MAAIHCFYQRCSLFRGRERIVNAPHLPKEKCISAKVEEYVPIIRKRSTTFATFCPALFSSADNNGRGGCVKRAQHFTPLYIIGGCWEQNQCFYCGAMQYTFQTSDSSCISLNGQAFSQGFYFLLQFFIIKFAS
jgi:hypothetical protein